MRGVEAAAIIFRPLPARLSAVRVRSFVGYHWPVLALLCVGVIVRIGAEIAYHPALFFDDSWEYLGLALQRPFVGFQVDRPSGYPLLVWAFTLDGRHLIFLTIVQHLAGLGSAVLIYAIGLRLRLGRWVSAALAALVGLGGDWIALEQFVMAESLFTFCILASALAALGAVRRPWILALSGFLLGAAVLMRTAGVFLVPAWVLFMIARRVGWRPFAVAAVALLVPLVGYSSLHAADGRGIGLSESSGWFLYARVAPVARCSASWPRDPQLRRVCPTAQEQAEGWAPGDYLWDASAPANRVYVGMYSGDVHHSSSVLKSFAVEALERRPLAYAGMVASDVLSVFNPAGGGWEAPVRFAAPGSHNWVSQQVRRQYLAGYRRRTDGPQSELRAYWSVVHTPRVLLGILTLAGLLSLGFAAGSRRWRTLSMPAETLLLTGMGFLLLVGTIGTSAVNMRYVLPTVPLLALGGACALRSAALAAVDAKRGPLRGGQGRSPDDHAGQTPQTM
jgi:hypothetical protein